MEIHKMEKKEQNYEAHLDIRDLLPFAIVIIVTGLAIAFGANIMVSLQSGFAPDSASYNATSNVLSSLNTLTTYFPQIALVIVASVIIVILVRYLGGLGGTAR